MRHRTRNPLFFVAFICFGILASCILTPPHEEAELVPYMTQQFTRSSAEGDGPLLNVTLPSGMVPMAFCEKGEYLYVSGGSTLNSTEVMGRIVKYTKSGNIVWEYNDTESIQFDRIIWLNGCVFVTDYYYHESWGVHVSRLRRIAENGTYLGVSAAYMNDQSDIDTKGLVTDGSYVYVAFTPFSVSNIMEIAKYQQNLTKVGTNYRITVDKPSVDFCDFETDGEAMFASAAYVVDAIYYFKVVKIFTNMTHAGNFSKSTGDSYYRSMVVDRNKPFIYISWSNGSYYQFGKNWSKGWDVEKGYEFVGGLPCIIGDELFYHVSNGSINSRLMKMDSTGQTLWVKDWKGAVYRPSVASIADAQYVYILTYQSGHYVGMWHKFRVDGVQPVADFNVSTTTPSGNQTVQFTFNGTTGENPSFEWDFGDGSPSATGPTPTHAYAVAGIYDVNVTVVDADGENSTMSRADYITVVVDTQPVANITCNVTVFDEMVPILFTADVQGGNAPFDYQWQVVRHDPNATGPSFPYMFPRSGPANVTLTVTDADGDVSVDRWTIVVENNPPVASFYANVTAIYEHTSVKIIYNGTGGNAPFIIYRWTLYRPNGGGSAVVQANNAPCVQNASFMLNLTGWWRVTLEMYDADYDYSTAVKDDYIHVLKNSPSVLIEMSGGASLWEEDGYHYMNVNEAVVIRANVTGGNAPLVCSFSVLERNNDPANNPVVYTGIDNLTWTPTKAAFYIIVVKVEDVDGDYVEEYVYFKISDPAAELANTVTIVLVSSTIAVVAIGLLVLRRRRIKKAKKQRPSIHTRHFISMMPNSIADVKTRTNQLLGSSAEWKPMGALAGNDDIVRVGHTSQPGIVVTFKLEPRPDGTTADVSGSAPGDPKSVQILDKFLDSWMKMMEGSGKKP